MCRLVSVMIEINDTWFAAEAQKDGLPVFLRGRGKLRNLIGLESHPSLIRITWSFKPANAAGMPDMQLHKQMADFEEILINSLEQSGLCIFYSIYLHNGVKEWSAYCSNTEAVITTLNNALDNHEKYQINISHKDDPEWEDYQALMEKVGQ